MPILVEDTRDVRDDEDGAIAVLPLFVLSMNRFRIVTEEALYGSLCSEAHEQYSREVGRRRRRKE